MGRRQQPVLAAGERRLEAMSREELLGVIKKLAGAIADIDATCNRTALPGEMAMIGRCGCCGENEWSHNRLTPHRPGCPIATALTYCRNGFFSETT